MNAHRDTRTHMHKDSHTQTQTHAHTNAYAHTHTHTHTHKHTHTHTCNGTKELNYIIISMRGHSIDIITVKMHFIMNLITQHYITEIESTLPQLK